MISRARILFLHHSVGDDILDGIQQLEKAYGRVGAITRAEFPAERSSFNGVIIRFRGGANSAPGAKIR